MENKIKFCKNVQKSSNYFLIMSVDSEMDRIMHITVKQKKYKFL